MKPHLSISFFPFSFRKKAASKNRLHCCFGNGPNIKAAQLNPTNRWASL